MSKLNRWGVKASVAVSFLLAFSRGTWGQAQEVSAKTPELYFFTRSSKQLFWLGEPVVIGLELYSRSEQPILVSRLQGAESVSFKVTGPDGNEVPRQGETLARTQRTLTL
jgi:hypothetical protein